MILKIAFVFFCGQPSVFASKIAKIKSSLSTSKEVDFYSVGFSNNNNEYPDGHINFNQSDWQSLNYPNKGLNAYGHFSLKPGNCDLPIIIFANRFPNYDYIYVMEDDVEYTGDLSILISELSSDDADLLCTHLHDCPKNWDYKTTFIQQPTVSSSSLKLCFLPFFRISRRGISAIHNAYCKGLYGHHEIVWPFVMQQHKFTIQDIGGENTYTSNKYINQYYLGHVDAIGRKTGTFTPTPPMLNPGKHANKLYHPIKPFKPFLEGRIKRIKSVVNYYVNRVTGKL